MNGNTQNNLYKVYLIGFFLILALPLLATAPWFHPADWGKTIVFRIIISSLLFFIIWQLISKKTEINFKELLDKKSEVFWPFWLLVALWGIFLLATIFSLDPYYSFWESPYRAGGFLNFSLYIIFSILAFLIIRKKDWQKIWVFAIFIGLLVSIIAIFQKYSIFGKIIIAYTERPPSTMGGPTFLAFYLLLLTFITFSFLLKEKGIKKKLFYFFSLLIFVYVIVITGSRSAYFGLLIGFFYFIFSYPKNLFPLKKKVLLALIKILAGILLAAGVWGVYYINYVNKESKFFDYLNDNKVTREVLSRLSIRLVLEDPRFSAWLISLEAIKQRPVLGYGPENFSIAFDKYYDPSLPFITRAWGSWYDKAHNFLFDTAVAAGIPALIIYLSFFAVLFWELGKIKHNQNNVLAHGIQATFFAYLAANFFSFDAFSIYLILFLLIGYSLSLINREEKLAVVEISDKAAAKGLWKSVAVFVLFCILIVFIWSAALKPLSINKEINWADYYFNTDQCQKALEKMEKNVLSSQSIIDSYAKFKYIEIVEKCNEKMPGLKLTLAPKVISNLKQTAQIRPYYTRTWLFLGKYTNLLIENKDYFKIENVEELKKESYSFFEKALQLSPKRDGAFVGLIETDFLSEEYQTAKEKAEECINLIPDSASCWWKKALAYVYLGEFEKADISTATAVEKKFNPNLTKPLSELNKAYMKVAETTQDEKLYIESYKRLADVYQRLIMYADYKNFQYHASLAYVYKTLGEYEKARKEALIVIELSPDLKEEVEKFLKTLPR